MPSQIFVHTLPASGQFSLPVSKSVIQAVTVAGVDVVFTLRDGSRHVVQGLALRAMTDPTLRILLVDANIDGASLIQATGKIHLDAIISKAVTSDVMSASQEKKAEAQSHADDTRGDLDRRAQQREAHESDEHVRQAPAPDAGLTQETRTHKDDSDSKFHETNPDKSQSILIISPSTSSAGTGGGSGSPPPPVSVARITVASQLHNVEGLSYATVNGKTEITGSGGAAHSATDFSPTVQAAREAITGSTQDDVIRGDGGSGMGSGFARVIDIQLSGRSEVTVTSVTLSGLPPGFVPVGATQENGAWTLALPTDLAASGNQFSVTIQYPVAADDQPFSPTTFELKVSASGLMNGESIAGELTIPAIIQDVTSPADMVYSAGGKTGTVFPAFGLGDEIHAGTGDDIVHGLIGHDMIFGDAGNDALDGGAGSDVLDGGAGADTLLGGSGQDTVSYANSADGVSVDLASGLGTGGDAQGDVLQDVEHLTGSSQSDQLRGNASANKLEGGAGDDTLAGRGGADTISGSIGADTADYIDSAAGVTVNLSTGLGAGGDADGDTLVAIENVRGSLLGDSLLGDTNDNTLDGQAGNDTIQGGAGADNLLGGAGIDTATYAASAEGVIVSLASAQGSGGDAEGDLLQDIENLTGSRYADELTGDAANNRLDGGAGNDWLEGGIGADQLIGGNGLDTASYIEAQSSVVVSLENPAINTGEAQGDSFTSIENLEGSEFNDTLIGDGNANVLLGGPGSDDIQGKAGDDTLVGGAGSDSLDGGDGIDTANYAASNEAVDVDLTTSGPQSGGDADGDTITNIENVLGSRYGDRLVGDAGDNVLNGGAGSDTLLGGIGADRLIGGSGVDTVDYSSSVDAVYINLVSNTAQGGDAIGDTFSSMENVVGGLNNDTLIGDATNNRLEGNDSNDSLVGNAGNDSLIGGSGDDLLDGGSGSDQLAGGTGDDTVSYSNSKLAVQASLLNGIGTGGDAEGDTLDGFENLTGSAQGDLLTGNTGANIIDGGAGDDTLEGGAGADVLIGGTGNNTASYAGAAIGLTVNLTSTGANSSDASGDSYAGIQNLAGSAFNDRLVGDASANILDGAAGNDRLIGLAGADSLKGGDGIDTADYIDSAQAVNVHLGQNTGTGGDAEGDHFDSVENVIGTAFNDTLTGNASDNRLEGGSGDDTLQGAQGADTMVGGAGTNTVSYSEANSGVIANLLQASLNTGDAQGDSYDSIVHLVGSSHDDTLTGDGNANRLSGGDGNDVLEGGVGTDTMDGGVGLDTASYAGASIGVTANLAQASANTGDAAGDTYNSIENLQGSSQNDALIGDTAANSLDGGDGNDLLNGGAGADTLAGGAGIDTVTYATSATGVNVNLGTNVNTGGDAQGDIINAVENVIGTAQGDTLVGDSGANRLEGGQGNDMLDGNTGADTLIGNTGDDIYDVDNAGDIVTESASEGTDTVRSSLSYTLVANVENLTLTGAMDINATGNDLDNALTGNSGANTLDGGLGTDTMTGAAGDDTYVVDNAADTVVESADGGTDTVNTNISFVLAANIENLTLTGSGHITATGNELGNVLTGNTGNNTLDGGVGADTLAGGVGNDSYIVDNAGDVITEASAEGTDAVLSSVSYVLSDNIENLTLAGANDIDATGNALNNTLTGNSGNNTIDGGAGADTMVGDSGDDTYVVDNTSDVVTEASNEGADTIQSSVSYTLSTNVETLTLTGSANINATGNTLDNVLAGNDGDNALDGGAGADTMAGGAGDDTYTVDNAGDVITEALNEGSDTVIAADSYTLSDNLEALTLTGSANVNATGNTLDNTLTGNAGDNVLDGGLGADAMLGGVGNDTYVVDNVGDSVTELSAQGTDAVLSSVSFTVAANVENLTLTGSGSINATGNAQDNALTGNSGDNALDGGAGADTMAGGTGNDTYYIDNAGDVVTESASSGTDIVNSSLSYVLGANLESLTLTGSANINATGNSDNNTLTGNSGDNTLDGSTGADAMAGGAGNDTYVVDNASDVITESGANGTDLVLTSVSYAIGLNIENLTLTGSVNINATGNALDNTLTGNSGDNSLDGGAGVDTMAGGAGNDIYFVDNASDVITESNAEGTDEARSSVSYSLSANIENLTLTGSANIDATGNSLDNNLTGNTGDNTIDGGTGADTMTGGAGNDTYVIDNSADVVVEASSQGTDIVQASVSHTLSANIESLTLTGTTSINATGNTLNNTLTGNSGDNTLDGGAGADTIAGGAGNDTYVIDNVADVITEASAQGTDTALSSISRTLDANVENLTLQGANNLNATGNTLDNVLTGNSGDNTLDGQSGADTMVGGAGDDSYVVDNVSDIITESSNQGTDAVQSSVSFTLSDNVETLNLTGSANINATGSAQDNTLTGNAGNNTLDGSAGADAMAGSAGDDTYVVDNTGDVITEYSGQGSDTALSSITYTLSTNIENLTLTGSGAIDATGNTLANILTGNSNDNVLDGGTGADTLIGGTGNDTYVIDNAGDVITESSGQGTDTVRSSLTYTLGADLENLTLTGSGNINATGNASDNVLTGNSGNNNLDGGSGADTMAGDTGNDTYVVDDTGDVVIEASNQGTDLVQSSVSYTLSANIEDLTLTGAANINASGNAQDNTLTGNSGDNTLDGAAGADTMIGAAGNDTYLIDDAADVITEASGQGTDTALSSISYTLSSNVENLTLTGTANVNATGNAQDNLLTGNSANNTLDGGTGIDTMQGGDGSDNYVVDNTSDVVLENANEGTDTISSSVSYSLSSNIENLTLIGSSTINATGNGQDNVLTGNSAANILDGGIGADTLAGGTGNDTYIVDNTADVVQENAAEGNDTVQASVSYTLTSDVDNLTLTGSANINATGNTLSNSLLGNSGDNTLDGATGADTMTGGLGNDTYVIENASDVIVENLSEGTDTATASVSYTLSANVENITLTGSGNIDATGNSLANTLIGNSGNNTLDGAAGNDTMQGGLGDDAYVVDSASDVVTENASEGTDTILTSLSYVLGNNLENLTLTGSTNLSGTGNSLANVITGNSGNNALDGGTGADTMSGDVGDDTYAVDSTSDVIVENASEGNDTVNASNTYALSSNIEALVLTGSGNIDGTGNAQGNTITGNSGNNVLDGSAGTDTLTGGLGNDTYVVDNSGDTLIESASQGTDTVSSSISWTLATNFENLTLTGSSNINGTGTALANVITGNAGDNVLTGAGGADTLAGAAGNDSFIVTDTSYASIDGGSGVDTVKLDGLGISNLSTISAKTIGIEALDFSGSTADSFTVSASAVNTAGFIGSDGNGRLDILTNASGSLAGQDIVFLSSSEFDNVLTPTAAASVTLTGGSSGWLLTAITPGQASIGISNSALILPTLTELSSTWGLAVDPTVTSISNLYTWLDATDLDGDGTVEGLSESGLSGSSVTTWADKSGNANPLSQATATAKPTYVLNNTNGNASVTLDGTDYLTSTKSITNTYTIFTVGQMQGTQNARLVGASGSSVGFGWDSGYEDRWVMPIGSYAPTTTATTSLKLYSGTSSGATDTLYSNGQLLGSFASTSALGLLEIGGTSGATMLSKGNVDEVLVFSRALSDAERVVIEGYLRQKWGVAGTSTPLSALGSYGAVGYDTTWTNAKLTFGSTGADTIAATYNGSSARGANKMDAVLFGGAGSDSITGGDRVDALYGGTGDDTLDGGTSGDWMTGGTGNDTYVVDNTIDVVIENANEGTDTILSSVNYTLLANIENLTLTGSAAINATGNTMNNVLTGNTGDNVLDGGTGADTMVGSSGNDTYTIDNAGDVITENASEGTDLVRSSLVYTLGNNLENLTLTGTAITGTGNTLDNYLTGNASANNLSGAAGNDTLDGSTGADTLTGSTGDDTYLIDNVGDVVTESASEGTDTVRSAITYTIGGNVENLTLSGAAVINGTGNTLDNYLTGNTAVNTLTALAGNDTLDGGTGADVMVGGTGNDTYYVDNASDVITENASEGTDLINATITFTLSANVENLTLTGVAVINGTGNTLDNVLTGNSAVNTLNGGTGNDTMAGGVGNDAYVVDSTSDVVIENLGEGTDLVTASATYTLSTNVENLTLSGALAINGTGNTLANTLTGNTGDNVLDGGTGNDTMVGGTGNDTYYVDATTDVVTEAAASGTDLVYTAVTLTLATNVENLTLLSGGGAINGTGNTLDNVLTGNASDNTLNGSTGNDTMVGGAGNDTYVIDANGDVITENASEGTDLVTSTITTTLGLNLENLTLTGAGVISGTGNTQDNYLTGNTAANTLTGLAGNDTLDGGTGADTLVGGTGNDTYVVDNVADVITENASEGSEQVNASVTYTLASNVENLTLTGAAVISGTGNTLDNYLTGNTAANTLTALAGNDTLNGGTGNDTMVGGTGNDTYYVDATADVITENASEGTEQVYATATYTLGNNVENLTLTGGGNINGTGNTLDNVLTGNSGNNTLTGSTGNDTLDGGTGADTLVGGTGNDSYYVDNSSDVVTESAAQGTDQVYASISHTLAINVENLTLTGASNIDATGNSANNTITGNTGDNVLTSGGGVDSLAGDIGNDTLVAQTVANLTMADGGTGNDTLQFTGVSLSFDLSTLVGKAQNIETLDVRDSANTASLTLSLSNVLSITDSRTDLTVRVDSGDLLTISTEKVVTSDTTDGSGVRHIDYALYTTTDHSVPAAATVHAIFGT
jgi:Ca2+-binding RTX toxin-like protein